jgi:hypothetical protein
MAAPLNSRALPAQADPRRYWAPCLGVALLAMLLFYVTLKDLVHESEARAQALLPPIVPAHVEAPLESAPRPAPMDATRAAATPAPAPYRGSFANANFDSPPVAAVRARPKPAPAVDEVNKCVMPEGDAVYSDGPCPDGAEASTLRLPRTVHASASL